MQVNTTTFNTEKIKGDFAELVCRHHFELMGCHVDKTGVEELSPAFSKLHTNKPSVQAINKHLQRMPDFLVVLPNDTDASFVEVKFRSNIDSAEALKELSAESHERYKSFIDRKLPIYFYLVTNRAPFVYIMKAESLAYREDKGGFYRVQDSALDRFPFFRGDGNHKSFNTVFTENLLPALTAIMLDGCK